MTEALVSPGLIEARVDARLRDHAAWIDASPDRQRLAEEWQTCVRMFGPESDPARGVLLGLVRLAWGERAVRVSFTSTETMLEVFERGEVAHMFCVPDRADRGHAEALLAALEAAPC